MTLKSPEKADLEGLRNARDVFDSLAIYVQPGSLAALEIDQSQAAIDSAIAELTTLRQQAGIGVPEGWRLVPVEPTTAMLEATGRGPMTWHGLCDDWSAMLTTSPQPPGDAPEKAVARDADLHDLITHRDAWRGAIILARDLTLDDQGTGYYTHELKAFDRTFELLETLATPKTPDAPEAQS